jgi:NADH-quinone oxidoreductase subunit J
MELAVFIVCAVIVLGGALGVILSRNAVHAALSLVATLFAVAVLFIAQDAQFLAAVQVIVYAGAIVVLFLFVIMLLGVDAAEDLRVEPLAGQRPVAVVAGLAALGLSLVVLLAAGTTLTGEPAPDAAVRADLPNITQMGRLIFTDWVFAFEATAILLTIAVVGAVVLARRPKRGDDLAPDADLDVDLAADLAPDTDLEGADTDTDTLTETGAAAGSDDEAALSEGAAALASER